jgi:hypothetical protein
MSCTYQQEIHLPAEQEALFVALQRGSTRTCHVAMPFGLTAMRTAGLGFDVGQAANNAPHGRLPRSREFWTSGRDRDLEG